LTSILFVALSTGCAPSAEPVQAPSSAAPAEAPLATDSDEEQKSPWEACYSTFAPTGNAKDDLARLVRDCGATGGMRPVTTVQLGEQAANDPVDRYLFDVPAAGKCYRVYAAGDASIKDLDLLLRGASADSVAADVTHDSWPVLPPREPACFSAPGHYLLEVSVYRGAGHYALQIWGR
jgi:hypothetical protein